MNLNKLLFEVIDEKNKTELYDYEISNFIEVALEANITLMNYLKTMDVPYFYAYGYNEYEYITFSMNKLIPDNYLFKKYGVTINHRRNQLLQRKDKKFVNDCDTTYIQFPLKLLIDFGVTKEKWMRLEKTM